MQTFLPYPDFEQSAKCLDYRRLGKQRIETKQILKALLGESTGWANHPATKMWRGYEYALCIYGIKICTEWINRNYKDNQLAWFSAKVDDLSAKGHALVFPHWFNDFNFHLAHRSNLLRKNPDYYGKFNWNVPSDLPYIWPSEKE